MTAYERHRANAAIQSLSQEWGKTPEETRQILVASYANLLETAPPIDRLRYYTLFKTNTPTAEEIVLQIAKEIIPDKFKKQPAEPIDSVSRAWAAFEAIAKKENTTPEEVRRSIVECIDEAYATTDPATRAKWNHLFPKGKPTPEAFIVQIGHEFCNR